MIIICMCVSEITITYISHTHTYIWYHICMRQEIIIKTYI